jgi:hypothetical protein
MTGAFQKISSGFRLVYIGLLLVVLAVVGGMLLVMFLAGGGPGNAAARADEIQMVVLGMVGLIVTGNVVGLIGRFQCLAVPQEIGEAKQLIAVSVALEATSMVTSLVNAADEFNGFLPEGVKLVAAYAPSLMSVLGAILFLLYTRAVADFIRRRDLGVTAMSVLWIWVLVVVMMVAAIGVLFAVVGPPGARAGAQAGPRAGGGAGGVACVASLLVLAAGITALVNLARYAGLLIAMSAAAQNFAHRLPHDDAADRYEGPRRDDFEF